MVRQSAIETLVRLAVVKQIADAVHRVFENRGCGKDDHSDLWINKGNDVESRYEAGDLTSEAEVFECVHDNGGICQRGRLTTESNIDLASSIHQLIRIYSSQYSSIPVVSVE